MSFCERSTESDGVVSLKLIGGGDNHYLTIEGLDELRRELALIRVQAASNSWRGLITTTSSGSFCDGIDYASLSSGTEAPAEHAKALAHGMACVMKELMAMPMLTVCAAPGNAASLGFALALAHDDLVVNSSASYRLGMVEDGVAVHPHIGALIREKTDRWYTLTTLKSRWRSGHWLKNWYFADAEAGSQEDVLNEAHKLVQEWTGSNGELHAVMRRQLFRETWAAIVAETN